MARSLRLARVFTNARNVGLSVSRSHFLVSNTIAPGYQVRAAPSITLAKHFSAAAQPEGESLYQTPVLTTIRQLAFPNFIHRQ